MTPAKTPKRIKRKPLSIGWGTESEVFERKSLGLGNGFAPWANVVKVYRYPHDVKRVYWAHKIAELVFPGIPVRVEGSKRELENWLFEPPAECAKEAPKLYMRLAPQNPELVEYQRLKIRLARLREKGATDFEKKAVISEMDAALERHRQRLMANPGLRKLLGMFVSAGIIFDYEPHNIAIAPEGGFIVFDIHTVLPQKLRNYLAAHNYPERIRAKIEKRVRRYLQSDKPETPKKMQ